MTWRRFELIAWAAALAGVIGAAADLQRAPAGTSPDAVVLPAAPALPSYIAPESLTSAVRRIADHDPFRIDHRPAAVSYSPELETAAPTPAIPPQPRPVLVLAGTVGGPPWAALVEGIPGREGAVLVRAGDVLGTLTVRSVKRDTVTILARDTVWRLSLKKPW